MNSTKTLAFNYEGFIKLRNPKSKLAMPEHSDFPGSLMEQFRILIPAKGNSRRAPGKNELLLPFTLDYVCHLGLEARTWVLTDSPVLAAMAEERGVRVLPETQIGDDFAANFTASYRKAGWEDDQRMVLLEPTKPLREEGFWNVASIYISPQEKPSVAG
jgi:hypothetical protein